MSNDKDRYNNLRKKLADHEFKDVFGIDAVPLIEKLFGEYMKACDSFKSIEEKQTNLSTDLASLQAQLFPLRKENAKLARENNELHLDHIHHVENTRREQQEYERRLRELSDELMELSVLNRVTNEQLKEKDKLLEKVRESYEGLVDPALKSKHGTSSSMKSNGRPPKPVNHQSVPTSQYLIVENDQSIIELLSKQLEEAHCKIKENGMEIISLKSAVAAREQELSRASKLIGNAAVNDPSVTQSYGVITGMDPATVDLANKRIIDQLNGQVDFLNSQLAFREAQISELYHHANELQTVNLEVSNKNHQMERLKDENSRVNARMKMMENKLLALGIVPSTPKSVSIVLEKESCTEAKDYFDETFYEDTINKLKTENKALRLEIISLQREIDLTQEKPSFPLETKTVNSSKGKRLVNVKGKRIPVDDGSSSLSELHEEVQRLKDTNDSLLNLLKSQESKVQYYQSLSTLTPPTNDSVVKELRMQLEEMKKNSNITTANNMVLLSELEITKRNYNAILESHKSLKDSYDSINFQYSSVQNTLADHVSTIEKLTTEANLLRSKLSQSKNYQIIDIEADRNVSTRLDAVCDEGSCKNSYKVSLLEYESFQSESQDVKNALEKRVLLLNQEIVLLQERNRSMQLQLKHQTDVTEGESVEVSQLKAIIQEQQLQNSQLFEQVRNIIQAKENEEMKVIFLNQQLDQLCSEKKTLGNDLKSIQQELFLLQNEHNLSLDLLANTQHSYSLLQEKCSTYEQVLIVQLQDQLTSVKQTNEQLSLQVHDYDAEMKNLNSKNFQLELQRNEWSELQLSLQQKIHELVQENEQLEMWRNECLAINKNQESKMKELEQVVIDLQCNIHHFEQKFCGIQQQYDELQFQYNHKAKSESYQQEDLLLITKENQSLSQELAQFHTENNQLQQVIYQYKQTELLMNNSVHALEIEKKDLLNHYRILLKEKRKLQKDIDAISTIQTEGVMSVQSLQKEYLELQIAYQVEQSNHEKSLIEKSSLLSQLELINESISQLQQTYDATEADNRRMIQEVHSMKQNNAMLNDRISMTMKRATAISEANKVLTSRLSSIEKERDSLRALIEIERQRASDMLKIAETARIEAATRDLQLQRYLSPYLFLFCFIHSAPTDIGRKLLLVSLHHPAQTLRRRRRRDRPIGNN